MLTENEFANSDIAIRCCLLSSQSLTQSYRSLREGSVRIDNSVEEIAFIFELWRRLLSGVHIFIFYEKKNIYIFCLRF